MTQRTVGADDVTGEFDGVVLDALNDRIGAAVDVETARATGAESDLSDDIAAETARALAAESNIDSDVATETANRTAADLLLIPLTQKGAAGGVATLDGGTKIPLSQLPSSVFIYRGLWNAATNTPTLADGTGAAGDTYRVSVGGTRNLGSGPIIFAVGDLVIYDGSVWQKSDSAESVTSVNSKTGTVVLDKTDIGLSNVDNTSDAGKPVSTAQAAAIAVVQADIDAHEADTANPHAVTKAQVGLGNADNTSDVNKPVSTAQAAADAAATAAAQATSLQKSANLSDLANAGIARTNLGLGTAATQPSTAFDASGAAAAAQAASQPLDPTLTALAGLATGANKLPYSTGTDTFAQTDLTAYARTLLDDADAATARTTLDVDQAGTAYYYAALAQAASQPLDSDLTAIAALDSSTAGAIASDGAGWIKKTYAQFKTALSLVKGDVGLGNVDNTSDTAKPVSTAQQTALDLKANLASPALTGNPTVPTASVGDNDTTAASTAFVQAEFGARAAARTQYTGDQNSVAYAIPTGATYLRLRGLAAGGGGGSARRGAATSVRCGGGGGGGGASADVVVKVSDLGVSTLYVDCAAGGAGGAAVTGNDTDGSAGSAPTRDLAVKTANAAPSNANTLLHAIKGNPGAGGTATVGTGGGGSAGMFTGASGAAASTTGLIGAQGSAGSSGSGSGGGSGGGLTSGDAQSGGGAGIAGRSGVFIANPAGGTSGGGAGNPGVNSSFGLFAGSSGSGGGSSTSAAGGTGGAGGRGAGGGGGGASVNGNNSGAGGVGGDGFVEITAYFF